MYFYKDYFYHIKKTAKALKFYKQFSAQKNR